ncbi:MAG: hypothetical protein ACYTGN_14930 [Planctomycetota bacterium]
MSQTGASLLVALAMLGLAIYLFFVPPPGFQDNFAHRIALPFVLVASAFGVLENLRTRAHMGQLVGALRSLMGQRGMAATPQVKAEAVEILLKSLRDGNEKVRQTSAEQLKSLTGQDFGEDFDAWEGWWAANKGKFGAGPPRAATD